MITSLSIPYVDVSAGSLTFRPDAPSMPVLDRIERDAGPLRLSLRLLGASHQAVVATPTGSSQRPSPTGTASDRTCPRSSTSGSGAGGTGTRAPSRS
ncbi:hypothetical protein GCM10029992_58310 [Glycomyces albus]